MAIQHEEPVKSNVPRISADRRQRERFPLTMNLRFRRVLKEESWTNGHSLNVSSTGILIQTDRPPYWGPTIEVVVDWPQRAGIIPKRELVVIGTVVRTRGSKSYGIVQYEWTGTVSA